MPELSSSNVVTADGVVTATVLDEVSPDRLMLYLVQNQFAAVYGTSEDSTPVVSRDIKDLVLRPFTED
jgi:hypothetical protein